MGVFVINSAELIKPRQYHNISVFKQYYCFGLGVSTPSIYLI